MRSAATNKLWDLMNTDGYFVEVLDRPRRIAFLVDIEQAYDLLFDEIVDFNICSWGGRFNPVIPVVDGKITDSYWRFLKLVDPDLLYTYCDLASGTAAQIQGELGPFTVYIHRMFRKGRPVSRGNRGPSNNCSFIGASD